MPGTLCGWSGPRATGASAAPTVHAPQLPPQGPHCDPLRNPRGPRHPLRRLPRGLQLHPLRAREANCLQGMRAAHTLSASGQRPAAATSPAPRWAGAQHACPLGVHVGHRAWCRAGRGPVQCLRPPAERVDAEHPPHCMSPGPQLRITLRRLGHLRTGKLHGDGCQERSRGDDCGRGRRTPRPSDERGNGERQAVPAEGHEQLRLARSTDGRAIGLRSPGNFNFSSREALCCTQALAPLGDAREALPATRLFHSCSRESTFR